MAESSGSSKVTRIYGFDIIKFNGKNSFFTVANRGKRHSGEHEAIKGFARKTKSFAREVGRGCLGGDG